MCSLAAMQSTPCAHQHASSSSCRRPRISHRQSLIPAVQCVVLHRQVCSAAGAAAGSSTAQVLPAQHGRQQQQHHILSQQKHQCQEQSALVARQTHNIDSNSSSSSTPSQKHSSKCSASGRSASARLSLQQLQVLLRQRPAPERPALLTCCIKACASWQQAALLFADHSHEFNAVHTAALISHLPKVLARQPPLSQAAAADVAQLLADLAQLAEEVLPCCGPRELSNMAQGLAAGGCYSRRLMQLLLGRCVLSSLRPQELASLAWAVAKTGHQVHEGWTAELLACSSRYMGHASSSSSSAQVCSAAEGFAWPEAGTATHNQAKQQQLQQQQGSQVPLEQFKPQELANLAWALAAMQQQCMLHSVPPLRRSCTRVDTAWKQQLCLAAAAQLWQANAADVSMVMWALAVLGGGQVLLQQQQQGWLDGQLARAAALAPTMQGRHIAMLLWSVSQLHRQQQHMQQQRAQRLSSGSPGSSSSITSSSSSSSSSHALQAFAAACFPRLQQLLPFERQPLRLCCAVLLAASHLQLQLPAAVLEHLLTAAGQQLQQQSAISWSIMRQSMHDGPQQQQQQQGVKLHDVTMLLYAMARLQYRPSRQFLAAADNAAATACWQLLLASKQRKQQQQQQGQVQSQYDAPPAPSSSSSAAAARPAAPSHVRVKDISLLLWSMGRLRHSPHPQLLRLLYKAAAARLHAASASDVGLMLAGLARLRARPRHAWLAHVLGHFLARLDDSVAAAPALANVIHALPHLPGGVILNQLLVEKLAEGQQLQQLAGAARLRFNECGARELVALAQGFAGLGFCPGVGWLAAHSQRCEALGGEGFSASERQLLEHAWAVLARLLQQQQSAEATTERVLPLEQEQWNGLQGAPLLAPPASTGGNVEQQRLRAAALAASV